MVIVGSKKHFIANQRAEPILSLWHGTLINYTYLLPSRRKGGTGIVNSPGLVKQTMSLEGRYFMLLSIDKEAFPAHQRHSGFLQFFKMVFLSLSRYERILTLESMKKPINLVEIYGNQKQ